jgi:hypothetical protein
VSRRDRKWARAEQVPGQGTLAGPGAFLVGLSALALVLVQPQFVPLEMGTQLCFLTRTPTGALGKLNRLECWRNFSFFMLGISSGLGRDLPHMHSESEEGGRGV